MASSASPAVKQLLRSRWIHRADPRPLTPAAWGLAELNGRLVELSSPPAAGALLTAAASLVLEAQQAGEPTAWITGPDAFYPPDLAERGVDLSALAVIRVERFNDSLRAADVLLRSGAFGLIVLDLASLGGGRGRRGGRGTNPAELPLAAQTRLAGLVQRHDAALVCLTHKQPEQASLGSLITLHATAARCPLDGAAGRFSCELTMIKDKRRGPGWRHAEICRGPPGLC
jgi:recombination protein RecA